MKVRNYAKPISLVLALCILFTLLPGLPQADAADSTAEVSTEATAAAEKAPVYQLEADCQLLTYVDEAVFTGKNHIARLPSEETLSSYAFLNSDGTKTVYYMNEEVKFIDTDGTVAEKDVTLTAAADGYTTTRNDIQLTIPSDPANGIRLTYDGKYITLVPQGGTLGTAAQATDSTVTYPDYFGAGMSLVYTPTLSGVKEDIVLQSYTGVSSFTFLLNTNGLNLYQASGRYFLAESKLATRRYELGDVVAFDARGKFSIGTMTVTTVMPGQAYRITVTADEAFLTDPDTVYPVAIDPTITVSDNTHGAGAIEDTSIYSGAPNANGNWTYLHSGYYDSTYQVARTLVRLTGLTSDSTYQSLTSAEIDSAQFHIREATGSPAQTVNLYANTGSSAWTESGATWNNAGITLGTVYATASAVSNSDTVYDITSLVKAWKNGTQTAAKGFVLVSSNETSVDKAFYSSEFGTTSYRPYVVVDYSYTSGSLNYTSIDIDEGTTKTLTVSGVSGTVSWSSNNTSVATVSSSGVVTGVKAGTATITANISGYAPKACTVYVTKPDGVYRIQNEKSLHYLGVHLGGIHDGTTARLQMEYTSNPMQLRQLWKIKHIGYGYYSIRPLHRLDQVLYDDSANGYVAMSLKNITESESGLSMADQWIITYTDGNYLIKNRLNREYLYPMNGATTALNQVTTEAYNSSTDRSFFWNFIPVSPAPVALMLYDANLTACLTSSYETTVPTKTIGLGRTYTLAEIGFVLSVCYTDSTNHYVTWTSSDTSVATVNSSTGAVTTKSKGETIITAQRTINGVVYKVQYRLKVVQIISVVNYYDMTISGDATTIDLIDDAISFLNTVYADEFGISFVMDGTPSLYASDPIAACSHGAINDCDDYCAFACGYHHKNVGRIAAEIASGAQTNKLYVLWSNSKENVFCKADSYGLHAPLTAAGLVCDRDTSNQSWDPYPVVQMLTVNEHSVRTDKCSDVAFMSVVLAHEVAHTLGLEEMHVEYPSHNNSDYNCIMSVHTEAKTPQTYVKDEDALCAYCKNRLHQVFSTNAFNGS